MKRTVSLLLILLLLTALPGLADSDPLLARIYAVNSPSALQAAHESCVTRLTLAGQSDHIAYAGRDYEVWDNPESFGGIRVRGSEYDYIMLEDGRFARFLALDSEYDPWQMLTEEMLEAELISTEEAGDALIVNPKSLRNEAADFFPDAIDSREVLVVDAETLEIRTARGLAIFADGTEKPYYEATVTFDVEPIYPEVIEAIERHLYEEEHDMRTTSLILDDGKPCKRTYAYETPAGDPTCIGDLVDLGYWYEIDTERSVPGNEAADNDAVYYLNRIIPEQ